MHIRDFTGTITVRLAANGLSSRRSRDLKTGLWAASDEETAFPSAIALPGHENLGLGRHWHFLADFAWLLTGLTYVVMLFVTPEWRRLIPDFLADFAGRVARVARLSELSYRGNAWRI